MIEIHVLEQTLEFHCAKANMNIGRPCNCVSHSIPSREPFIAIANVQHS